MNDKKFYTQLSLVTLASALLVAGSYFIESMALYMSLGWVYLIFFTLFVGLSYILGKKAITSTNKNDYTRMVLGLIFFKILLCIAIMVIYDSIYQPQGSHHIIYFIVLYILYSIFEYKILSQLSYQKS